MIELFKLGNFDEAEATALRIVLIIMLTGHGACLGRILDSTEWAAARLMSVVCSIAAFQVALKMRQSD